MIKKIQRLVLVLFCITLSAYAESNNTLTVTWDDLIENPSSYIGKTVEVSQTLYVVNNYYWNKYGEITLSNKRLNSPTDVAYPASTEYYSVVAYNSTNQITLSDGSDQTYPSPRPWEDENGTMRIGSRVDNLVGVFSSGDYGYTIVPTETPQFYGNPRPLTPNVTDDYNLKVCAFNLQYYLASDYGTGYGADNEEDAAKQHSKIMHALLAIDADIFGLVEIQQGQEAISKLTDALNAATVAGRYTYVSDGTTTYESYTKVGFIYRTDKVVHYGDIQSNNTEVIHRKKIQGFQLLSNGEKFVFSLNHFKAKSGSGSGDNADIGDGQGTYNGDRVREASAIVTFAKSCATYFGDDDILIMGDLNAYSMEDPITTFINAGYTNMLKTYHGDTVYSYNYYGAAGILDHILANSSMKAQITGCNAFHINTDEPTVFEYDGYSYEDNMYRCSDHDPVIVTLNLGMSVATEQPHVDDVQVHVYSGDDFFEIVNAGDSTLQIYSSIGKLCYIDNITSSDYIVKRGELNLNRGVYVMRIINNSGVVTSHKIIV